MSFKLTCELHNVSGSQLSHLHKKVDTDIFLVPTSLKTVSQEKSEILWSYTLTKNNNVLKLEVYKLLKSIIIYSKGFCFHSRISKLSNHNSYKFSKPYLMFIESINSSCL